MGLLVGTKAIAGYMKMDWDTVRKLIVRENFPARQLPESHKGVWYAHTQNIDDWGRERTKTSGLFQCQ